jgi:hypothetical protein
MPTQPGYQRYQGSSDLDSVAGFLPDSNAADAAQSIAQLLCLHKPQAADVVSVGMNWPTSTRSGGFRPPPRAEGSPTELDTRFDASTSGLRSRFKSAAKTDKDRTAPSLCHNSAEESNVRTGANLQEFRSTRQREGQRPWFVREPEPSNRSISQRLFVAITSALDGT